MLSMRIVVTVGALAAVASFWLVTKPERRFGLRRRPPAKTKPADRRIGCAADENLSQTAVKRDGSTIVAVFGSKKEIPA